MVAQSKATAKGKPTPSTKKDLVAKAIDTQCVSNLACPFRNLMRYRTSEECRRVFYVIMRGFSM